MRTKEYVGVDIAKAKFDVALSDGDNHWKEKAFDNNPSGYKALTLWLKKHTDKPSFVCMEATGHYGQGLAEYLHKQKIAVSVVNPMQIKHYAKARLTRNKNDRVDARLIALYAKQMQPSLFTPKETKHQAVQELAKIADTLSGQVQSLKLQYDSIGCKQARLALKQSINYLQKKMDSLEKKIADHIEAIPTLKEQKQRLLTIKGIGEKSAHRLLAYLPDLTLFRSAKQLAAFAGLSPRQFQSGQYQGKTRLSKFGDARLRKALYMPALVAKNYNSYFKKVALRLQDNGLKPKQIICAIMRKILHAIFGMFKHQQDFAMS